MYDIEGNLEFTASTTTIYKHNGDNFVETIAVDKFADNNTKVISIINWDLDNITNCINVMFVPTVDSVFHIATRILT